MTTPRARAAASRSGREAARPLRQRQKEATRQCLVEAGLEVFTERGYQAATVEEITDRAQVGRTTFYTHFQGKADVAFAVAFQYTAELNRAVARLGQVDPRDGGAIARWLNEVEDEFREHRVAVTLVIQATDADPAAAQHFVNVQFDTVQQVLDGMAGAGLELGDGAREPVRLMLMLVNRWMYLHVIQEVPAGEGSREALSRVIGSELDRCLSQSVPTVAKASGVEGVRGRVRDEDRRPGTRTPS